MRLSHKLGVFATKTSSLTHSLVVKNSFAYQAIIEKQPKNAFVTSNPTLYNMAERSHEVIGAARTVLLPNNIFPDSVILDRTKLTIIRRSFFWTSEVISFRVEDILNVNCGIGPFFGSITVSTRVMNSTDHYEIDYFWRKDAIQLKELIQGYMIALHNNIDTAHLSTENLRETLLELGRNTSI